MSGRHLDDSEVIEMVEMLRLAVEACRVVEGFASAALHRLGGLDPDTAELRHDMARLASMASVVSWMAEPASRARR